MKLDKISKYLKVLLLFLCLSLLSIPAGAVGSISGTVYNNTGIGGDVIVWCSTGIPGPGWSPIAGTMTFINTGGSMDYYLDMLPDSPDYCILGILDVNSNGDYDPNELDLAVMIYPIDVAGGPAYRDIYLGGIGGPWSISGTVYNNTDISGNVVVKVAHGKPGSGWNPLRFIEMIIDANDSEFYYFDNIAEGNDYCTLAILDSNDNGLYEIGERMTDIAAIADYPIIVGQGDYAEGKDITLEKPMEGDGTISGTIYNDTDESGVVMIACGPGVPGGEWEPFVISSVTVAARGSAWYVLNSIPNFSRLSVAAILDVAPYGDFDPVAGDPAGINYPVAVYPCRKNIAGIDIHIKSDIFGSVSGEVYNDTGFTGDVAVYVGYDSVGEYWVPVASASLYSMYPYEFVSYKLDNVFKGIEYTVAAVLDTGSYGDFDPFKGDPAGMVYPVMIDGDKTGVDVHISTNVFGSISGTIYNDSTYSGLVQIFCGFGEVDLYWMPVVSSSDTFLSAGGNITYFLDTIFLGTDYAIVAVLDVNSDGKFDICEDNVIGINYPVVVDGPVGGVDVHLKAASISGYVYDTSAVNDGSGASKGISDVNVTLSGTRLTNCFTDSNGYYELTDLQLIGDYVVTPVRSGWEFTPSSREYILLLLAKENQNFTCSFTKEEVEEISINIGENDTPVTIKMPEAGESKIVMPERAKIRKGVVNPEKGDYVAVIFKSKEQDVVGKEFIIRVFNLLGEQIGDPIKKIPQTPDDTWIKWIPEDLASGIYIIHVKGPGVDFYKKVPILR